LKGSTLVTDSERLPAIVAETELHKIAVKMLFEAMLIITRQVALKILK